MWSVTFSGLGLSNQERENSHGKQDEQVTLEVMTQRNERAKLDLNQIEDDIKGYSPLID